MKSEQDIKNSLKSVSSTMSKIHKMILENEIERIEKIQGVSLPPAARIQILLNDPSLAWLRPMSQLMSTIDGICFQKEPVTPEQPKKVYLEIEELFFKQNGSDFSKKYIGHLMAMPDMMIDHGHLKIAWKQLL